MDCLSSVQLDPLVSVAMKGKGRENLPAPRYSILAKFDSNEGVSGIDGAHNQKIPTPMATRPIIIRDQPG